MNDLEREEYFSTFLVVICDKIGKKKFKCIRVVVAVVEVLMELVVKVVITNDGGNGTSSSGGNGAEELIQEA